MKWKAIGVEQQNLDEIPLAAINPFRIIEADGKIGVEHYFTLQRKVIIPAEYDYIERTGVSSEIFFFVGLNRKFGLYNSEGKLIIDAIFDKISLENNIIIVRTGKFCGAYDYEGNQIVPTKYAELKQYDSGIIVRNHRDNFGAYDYQGVHIVPDRFVECKFIRFAEGSKEVAFVKKMFYDGYGVYDTKGTRIIPPIFSKLVLGENFIIADKFEYGIVYDYDGNVILPKADYPYYSFNGKLIYTNSVDGWKVYDKTGKEVEPGMLYKALYPHDEFLAAKVDGHWKILYSE